MIQANSTKISRKIKFVPIKKSDPKIALFIKVGRFREIAFIFFPSSEGLGESYPLPLFRGVRGVLSSSPLQR
ncbi:MAG: hypothetical protein AABZ60_11970, partial [Planctomycetota bacterium]